VPLGPRRQAPPEVLKEFGDALRGFRLQAGLSQEELAHKAGRHFTYVSSVERGERNLTLSSIYLLAAALEIPVTALFAEIPSASRVSPLDRS